jgi:hypothetical protein
VQPVAVGEEFGEVQPAGARLLERNGENGRESVQDWKRQNV